MATVKLNSRSPYFIVAAGTEGCGDIETQSISISGPNTGTVNTDITLSVVANNFTPASYLWTGGAAAGSTLKEITFTETSSGAIDYGVTVTSDCGTQFTTSINVSWNTVAQYEATLTIDNQITGPSQGYTIGGDLNGAKVTGVTGDPYSFTTTLALNDGYTADVNLAISPTQPNAGNFATDHVSVTTTLTGTVSLNAEYYLERSASSVIEGDTFTITLDTKNVPDGAAVPFIITGIQSADLKRNSITGSFVVNENTATQTFEVVNDLQAEVDETFTLTLNDISPIVSIDVLIRDKNTSQAQTVKISEAFTSSSLACATNVTTNEDAHYGLLSSEVFGNGTILFKDMLLTERYGSAGKYYKITYNGIQYNAIVGANNQGEISNFAECTLPIVPIDEDPPEGTDGEDFVQKEPIADTTPTFTCAIAGIEIYDGVVGESLNYSIKNGGGTVTSYFLVNGTVENPGYVLGANDYTFNIKIPKGYKEVGGNKECIVSGTGIAALPTWDCTNTALDVKDGATGESISYSYSSEIKDSDIVSIKNSSGGTVYLAGSDTYTFIHKIPTGYQGAGTNLSCTDTATGTTTPAFTCDIAQFSITNGVEGNSTLVNSSVQGGTLTAVSPSTYTVGSDTYTATITIPSGYSNYPGTLTTCTDTANGEEIQLPPSNSVPISSTSIETVGSGGEFPCELELDKVIYYQGTLQNFIQVFNGPELTSPFVGVGNYHHIQIPNPDGELIDWYCRVNFGGIIFSITQCKIDIITDDDGEAVGPVVGPELDNVTVNVTASSSDGTAINSAFTSQKVTLLASVSGLTTTAKYQWYKGTTAAGGTSVLTAISGETNSTLVINDGGETQTSAGTFYYNCLVNDTFEDESNYLIVWDARPSFSLKYYSSQEASISACTGTSVTLYGDRAGVTAFCVAEKFYSNAAGTTGGIAAGTYSDSTDGTNNNFRYIEASGIPQGCVPYGCEGPPVVQPTTGTIQKVYARRCQGQDSPGRYEYFLFDGFEGYLAGQHILDIKDVGQVGGRGCYEIIQTFDDTYTLPDGYIKIQLTDLARQQPYPNCDECLGIVEEVEEEVVIQKYYARFIKCGTDGGNITAVSSTSPISTSLVVKTGNECREYLDDVEITNATDLSLFTTFFGCQACLESITPTADEQDPDATLGFFRNYGDCATNGSDILKSYGATSNLDAYYPPVILDSGLCMKDLGTVGLESSVNIQSLLSFETCAECDAVANPAGPVIELEPDFSGKITVSSETETTSRNACNNIQLFDIKVAYSGTLQDGTYLYTNDTLTNLYTPTSTNFVKSSNGYTFKIGATNPGQVSELKLCNEI